MSERAGAERRVTLRRIYLQDASVEVPDGPQAFDREGRPRIDVDLDTRVHALDEPSYHVTLRVTVTARVEERTAYIVEVHQAGLFTLRGFDDDAHHRLLGVRCPEMLFPYVREAVSDLVVRAGFSPFLLQPIDFEALYRRRLQSASARAPAGVGS